MNLSKLLEIVKAWEPGVLQSMGLQRVGRDLATEWLQQTAWDWLSLTGGSSLLLFPGSSQEVEKENME